MALGHRAPASTGALVKFQQPASGYGFDGPEAITTRTAPQRLGGERVWQPPVHSSSRPGSAPWSKVISARATGFNGPRCHHLRRDPVWVANWLCNSVTALLGLDRRPGEVISGSIYGVQQPRRRHLGRDPRLGGRNEVWHLRSPSSRPRPAALVKSSAGFELSGSTGPRCHHLGRHPRLGGELGWHSVTELSGLDRPAFWSRSSAARATGFNSPGRTSPRTGPTSEVANEYGTLRSPMPLGLDRRPGQGHQRLDYRVIQQPERRHLGRDPPAGWRTPNGRFESPEHLGPGPAPWSRSSAGSSYGFRLPVRITSDGHPRLVANYWVQTRSPEFSDS